MLSRLKVGVFNAELQCSRFCSNYVGRSVTCNHKFTTEDVQNFAKLTGDFNPLHFDEIYAKSTGIFSGKIVHGALINSYVGGILGTKLSGSGTIAFSSEIKFPSPLYFNEEFETKVEISSIKKRFIECSIFCQVPALNKVILKGKTVVMLLPPTCKQ